MTTSANQNQGQVANPTWMSDTWVVSQVPSAMSSSLFMTDTMTFVLPNTIKRTLNIPQTSQSGNPLPTQDWGTWDPSSVTQIGLNGTTSDGIPFQIFYNGSINCIFDTALNRRRGWTIALGTFVGALTGAAVGVAARAPGVGALAGFVAGLTASATAVARFIGVAGVSGGADATWIKSDSGIGGVPKEGPRSVPQPQKVSA